MKLPKLEKKSTVKKVGKATDKDKKEMVRLYKKGYPSVKIAKAFDTSRQSVAAYVAWDTMRSSA